MPIPLTPLSKIYSKTRQFYRDGRHVLGFNDAFYRQARGSRIVVYHGICQTDHTRFNPIFLKQQTFEAHLRLYKKYCNVVSLDDYYQKKFSTDKFNICLTFDDGFSNNYNYVLPLLEECQMPATFFITAIRDAGHDVLWNDFLNIVAKYGPEEVAFKNVEYHKDAYGKYVDSNDTRLSDKLRKTGFEEKAAMMEAFYPLVRFKQCRQNQDYWQQMTMGQIKALSASRFAHIGAHGYYHNDLAQINIDDAYNEMLRSKLYLEDIIQKPVDSLAFPYGSYNEPVIKQAFKAGYRQLLATDFVLPTDGENSALRERFTVNPFISPVNQLFATINRRYD